MPRKTKTRKAYSESFKIRAVKLAQKSEKSVSEVARDLGVAEKSLLAWVRAARQREARGEEELTASEKEELKVLRAEVRGLHEEIDILKKATKYFAGQSV